MNGYSVNESDNNINKLPQHLFSFESLYTNNGSKCSVFSICFHILFHAFILVACSTCTQSLVAASRYKLLYLILPFRHAQRTTPETS